jgi:hypothetical protein
MKKGWLIAHTFAYVSLNGIQSCQDDFIAPNEMESGGATTNDTAENDDKNQVNTVVGNK